MTTKTTAAVTPSKKDQAPPIVPLMGDEPAMREWAAELVERARCDGAS
jgi:hypothetical protein